MTTIDAVLGMLGGLLMYGWALWFVAALLVGALLLARDEWRLRQRGKDNGHE